MEKVEFSTMEAVQWLLATGSLQQMVREDLAPVVAAEIVRAQGEQRDQEIAQLKADLEASREESRRLNAAVSDNPRRLAEVIAACTPLSLSKLMGRYRVSIEGTVTHRLMDGDLAKAQDDVAALVRTLYTVRIAAEVH